MQQLIFSRHDKNVKLTPGKLLTSYWPHCHFSVFKYYITLVFVWVVLYASQVFCSVATKPTRIKAPSVTDGPSTLMHLLNIYCVYTVLQPLHVHEDIISHAITPGPSLALFMITLLYTCSMCIPG